MPVVSQSSENLSNSAVTESPQAENKGNSSAEKKKPVAPPRLGNFSIDIWSLVFISGQFW